MILNSLSIQKERSSKSKYSCNRVLRSLLATDCSHLNVHAGIKDNQESIAILCIVQTFEPPLKVYYGPKCAIFIFTRSIREHQQRSATGRVKSLDYYN
jgi:hypothetical protein